MNIRNIFLTADKQKNIVFISMAKISSKKVCEKMKNNATLEKLLRLVGATFDFKMASLRKMKKKNLIFLKSLQFVVVDFCIVKYQLKVFGKF